MRYRFGAGLRHAFQVRGLDMQRVADEARVSPATVSSAVRGGSLNMATAIRIARVVSQHPVVPELDAWSATAVPPTEKCAG